MSAVLINSNRNRGRSRRRGAVRLVSATLVAVAIGGLLAAGQVQLPAAEAAAAAAATDSKITVDWTGDKSSAAEFQPKRDPKSVHKKDFEKLSISVSQTKGIIDQAIRVSVAGFAGTRSFNQSGLLANNAQNYLQAMQCWGSDPAADDFRETCQWGGRYGVTNSGLSDSVFPDNASRTGVLDQDTTQPTDHDVVFRPVSGKALSGKPTIVDGQRVYPILNLFGPSTTNEVTSARVNSDGKGFFDFETQSSDQAPQLGCGTAAHLRCWLIIVPRGTVFGGLNENCSSVLDPTYKRGEEPYPYGREKALQIGSPINDDCDYWDNRIVVPLDFAATGNTCPVGSSEVRVIGSELMVGAMSSWQPSLCKTVKSTFSFATNPDSVARSQLIATTNNSPNIAYASFPVSSGELQTEFERQTLAETDLTYAPVAISSVVLGFIAEFDGGRQEKLNISPRIMAKLLTQSYPFLVPSNSSDPSRNIAHLPAVNRTYNYLNQDPDFRSMNPDNWNEFTANPAVVLPGPSGADAIRQVWRWILADKDALAFLNGAADPSGMTVNPYYLPKGAAGTAIPYFLDDNKADVGPTPLERIVGRTNLDGSPQKLADASLDTFPKDDESLVPLKLSIEKSRFDSIQFSPYSDNLLSGARQAFRANPNSKTLWDPIKLNAAGVTGDWVSSGTQLPGAKFMIAVTDSPSAGRYGLSAASIQVPNSKSVVAPTAQAMTKALAALQPTSLDAVKQVDPTLVASDGYPMTIVTYAGVNLSKASAVQRSTISAMIKQITSSGQISGAALGELPAGYLPLTEEMSKQATVTAGTILNYVSKTPIPAPGVTKTSTPKPASGLAQDAYDAGTTAASELEALADNPTVEAGVDALTTSRTEAASSTSALGGPSLVIALALGLAGLIIAPILLRGRGFR